jgi:putative zinc finger/helix-turn-helix YgiT family protein
MSMEESTAAEELDRRCPSCGRTAIDTEEIERRFPYGAGDQAVQLSAVVPLRRCRDCGFEFLDAEAEEKQAEAVCRHLGVMTSSEVRAIRRKAGALSRTEFARITRLGEATIGRWERGELIQNAANDQLLYLLTFPENVTRLRNRNRNRSLGFSSAAPGG